MINHRQFFQGTSNYKNLAKCVGLMQWTYPINDLAEILLTWF